MKFTDIRMSGILELIAEIKGLIHFWEVKLQYDRPFLAISVATEIELTIKHLKERLKQVEKEG